MKCCKMPISLGLGLAKAQRIKVGLRLIFFSRNRISIQHHQRTGRIMLKGRFVLMIGPLYEQD